MKRYINCIHSLLALLFIGFALSACSDQDYTELDKGRDQLTITADQALTALEETSHASDAVTLNWTTGNNYGTGNRISYRLELAKAGTDFAQPTWLWTNRRRLTRGAPTWRTLTTSFSTRWEAPLAHPLTLRHASQP